MARPDPNIVFHAQLSRVTGDQETLVVSFNGSDQGELRTRLRMAAEVMDQHVKKHNAKVLELTDEIRAQAEQAKREIILRDRRQLVEAGLIPAGLLDVNLDGGNGAADPAGPADLRTNS